MLVIWLGASAGAVGWGALAGATDVRTALLAAAVAHVAVTAVASLALRIGPAVTVDTTPLTWSMPELQVAPSADAGPVMITIEWQVDPARIDEFTAAMAPIRRQRRRDGGYGWRLYQDLESPGRMIEAYTVSTWAEHERQHHRAIAADDLEQELARSFLVDGTPVVHHLVAPAAPTGTHRHTARRRSTVR